MSRTISSIPFLQPVDTPRDMQNQQPDPKLLVTVLFAVCCTHRLAALISFRLLTSHNSKIEFCVQSKGGLELIRGILQLLEEWEYHFALAGFAHHSVKAMLAKNIDNIDHQARGRDAGEEGGSKHQEQVRMAPARSSRNRILVVTTFRVEERSELLLVFVIQKLAACVPFGLTYHVRAALHSTIFFCRSRFFDGRYSAAISFSLLCRSKHNFCKSAERLEILALPVLGVYMVHITRLSIERNEGRCLVPCLSVSFRPR